MKSLKAKWNEPMLTILVRCKPEEAVLNGCKSTFVGLEFPEGPQTERSGYCFGYEEGGSPRCPGSCDSYVQS